MDKKTVFIKTPKGESEGANLSSDLKRILSLIDSKSTVDELAKRAPPSLRAGCRDILGELEGDGFIRDKNKPQIEAKIATPKFNPIKMFTPKPAAELDFNTPRAVPVPNVAELAAKQKADEAAQLEAAVAAAKARASAEAAAKAEAKARQEAEILARGKALAEADAAIKAETKARKDAEIEERARAVAEANAKRAAELRAQAGAKAKQETVARMQAEQEAARNKAALEAAVRVRAEIEAAAKAQQVAEAKAKLEAAARMQAQQEAARVKAALEVAAREKAEAEAKAKRDAEAVRVRAEQEAVRVKAELEAAAKAKREAEAALLKAEQEAARIRAEMAAAKAKADAEAKALAEARAKQEAEEKALAAARARQEAEEKSRRDAETARLKAEHEAALLRAEQEAIAKVRAEAEARAVLEAEERARREAEAARLKAEYETALIKAEQDAVARVRAEAEAKLRAEVEANALAEVLARQLHEETVAKLEAEALAMRAAEIVGYAPPKASVPTPASPPAYEIQLDGFVGTVAPTPQTFAPTSQKPQQDSADTYYEDIAKAKSESESNPLSNVAAEMARLKEESEAARRKLEEEERRKSEELALAEEQARAWAEAEQRAKVQTLIEAEQSVQQAAMSQTRALQKPIVRASRKPMPLGKISLVLGLLGLIVVLVLPYVYPLAEYVAPLEQGLAAQLKQPVRIGGISAGSLPPRLELQNVTLGNAQEVKVGSVVLNFDVLSLLSDVKVISNAELQDIAIQGNLLDKQAASLKLVGANARFPVRHMTVQRLKIITDEVALPVFNGIVDIDAQGALVRVALHSIDDKLGIDLQSTAGRWQLGINLKERSLFFLPDVVFSDLSAKGDMVDGEVSFTELDAHIYNGILRGRAKLNWRKGWQLQGQLEAKTFELNKMFPKYGIEGELFGEGSFSFAGAKISQLDDAPHLDGSFSVKGGTINGIDMVETARLLSREHMVGGRTHFDDLIGLVQYDNGVTHFRQVKIASSALSASGLFDVSAGNQLGGNFSAEIKMRSGNNALTLFGTVTEPKLRSGY